MREPTPPISASGAKRRSARISRTVSIAVAWVDRLEKAVNEQTATVSISCHGFLYISRQSPQKNSPITFQVIVNKEDRIIRSEEYLGRVIWARKSSRLDGSYLVGVELAIPLNIWDVEDAPEDWAAFSPPMAEDPAIFLAEVERLLNSARKSNYYQLLGVEPNTSRAEVRKHFYHLARRFHPDHHMDHPDWAHRLSELMEVLTTAYEALSDDKTKKEYDALHMPGRGAQPSDSRGLAQSYLEKAQECAAERNFAGSILWLHRAIECEPDCSSHRALLGRCLSAIPEYRREAIEQFEKAIELDPGNLTAHLQYGELLEVLKAPWRAKSCYIRVLELDANNRDARERLNRLGLGAPRSSSRPSLLGRLTGRR